MGTLGIDQIKREASGRMEVAIKMEELQAVASRVFPGSRVLLVTAEDKPQLMSSFGSLSGMEQIITSMFEFGGGPMELQQLHSRLAAMGSSMSVDTLMSQLSRGKDDYFVNPSRGVWGLMPSVIQKYVRNGRG